MSKMTPQSVKAEARLTRYVIRYEVPNNPTNLINTSSAILKTVHLFRMLERPYDRWRSHSQAAIPTIVSGKATIHRSNPTTSSIEGKKLMPKEGYTLPRAQCSIPSR